MLASTCSIRRWIELAGEVLVPGVHRLELAAVDRDHRLGEQVELCGTASTNWRQVARIAGPLSLRKSAIVLKSGASRPVSHISSTLRWASRSRRRLDAMLVEVAVE